MVSAADAKSRARVSRLLSGDFRPDDLTHLFLYARDHCDGRASVAEIGHFVAHHSERNKGIVTRSTRDWDTVARYHMSRFGPGGPHPLDGRAMPNATKQYFRIAATRIDPKKIRSDTGLSRADAHARLRDLAERIQQNPDGTWALPNIISQAEITLVECVSSYLVVRPAFEAEHLVRDFLATLKSNGLITKDELRTRSAAVSSLILLYAVSAMHNCVIQIGDGSTCRLEGSADILNNKIEVQATVPAAVPGRPTVGIACSMFSIDLDPMTHCHPDLLNGHWLCDVEVAPDKRLVPLC